MTIQLKNTKLTLLGILLIVFVSSCKSYTIPVDSFIEQMKNTNSKIKDVEINNPLIQGRIKYSANSINKIIVLDKTGLELYLNNSPSIEMLIIHNNGKRYKFYFDTVVLENNILKGGRSRFIQRLRREIPMDSIVKIEIQDGGKKFNYQN